MSIPKQLLTYLNSGKCFALIGSGLSTALNYPSWNQLAKNAIQSLPKDHTVQDELTDLINKKDYPEVFERVIAEVGDISQVIEHLRVSFKPHSNSTSDAYKIICQWPIRCYLTTNYDDEISRHLSLKDHHFTTLNNNQSEISQITADSQRRIVKLHGDLSTPDDIVLTTTQYTQFETGGERQYFRNKLISIFNMVPMVVIGHSMTDPDLKLILKLVKESSYHECLFT